MENINIFFNVTCTLVESLLDQAIYIRHDIFDLKRDAIMSMKEEFSEFYSPTKQEFDDLWEKCTFVLDANVLLDLYRYSPNASNELTETLKLISDRLWIPHQVALEYNKNRIGVITKEKSKFKPIPGIIDNHMKELKTDLEKEDRARKNTYAASIVSALKTAIDESSKEIKATLEKEIKKRPDWLEKDDIREMLSELFKGKIGTPYKQEELNDIYKECQRRYDLRIPPGYKDAETKEGRAIYGDALLWLQIINYAKGKKLPVIFVTREDKVDWWNPETENKNDRQPDYDLIKEFTSETGCPFYIYTTDRFLFWAKKIGAKVSPETIEEIKQIRDFPYYIKDSPYMRGDGPTRSYTIRYEAIDSDDDKKAALISSKFKSEIDKYSGIISKEEASTILGKIAIECGFDRIRLGSWR